MLAWCSYDFANSSYSTLIITLVFSVYFREAVVDRGHAGDWLWSVAHSLAMGIVVVLSPLAGALADAAGWRKRMLVLTTLVTVAATALLALVDPGEIGLAIALYVVGTAAFEGSYVFYNAFLGDVATPDSVGRVSGWAWAAGFLGGLCSLALVFPWVGGELRRADGTLSPEAVADRQFSFLLVAAFYLVFALPALRYLRESRARRPAAAAGAVRAGWRRVLRTLSELRRYRETAKFVLASLLFTDGITTVIVFSAIYATETYGLTSHELRTLFLVLNLVAFPGAAVAGHLADRCGAKRTLVASLWLWIAVIVLGAAGSGKPAFWVMACGAALGMGATQAVGRSFMVQLTPPERAAEFFGFYVQSGKLASMVGPLLFGAISASTGNQRLAVLALLPLFVAGLLLLGSIDERRVHGRAAV